MTIVFLIVVLFAAGTLAYFLRLMADGRRLRERMFEPRPAFVPDEAEPETPLVPSDCAL